MPQRSDIPVPNPEVISQMLTQGASGSPEAILVMPRRGKIKVLNEVGAKIWTLIDGKRSIAEICAVIHAEYDVDTAQVELDALAFVDDLVRKGALHLTERPAK